MYTTCIDSNAMTALPASCSGRVNFRFTNVVSAQYMLHPQKPRRTFSSALTPSSSGQSRIRSQQSDAQSLQLLVLSSVSICDHFSKKRSPRRKARWHLSLCKSAKNPITLTMRQNAGNASSTGATELERLPSYTSTSRVQQPATAHTTRGRPSGETLPSYTSTPNMTLLQQMKAAQKSQCRGQTSTPPTNNTGTQAVRANANTNNANANNAYHRAPAAANPPAPPLPKNSTQMCALICTTIVFFYSTICYISSSNRTYYEITHDDERTRFARWAHVTWLFSLLSIGYFVYAFCTYGGIVRRYHTVEVVLVFVIGTMIPFGAHLAFAIAGPAPEYEYKYFGNGTVMSHNATVPLNGTIRGNLTAPGNVTRRASLWSA